MPEMLPEKPNLNPDTPNKRTSKIEDIKLFFSRLINKLRRQPVEGIVYETRKDLKKPPLFKVYPPQGCWANQSCSTQPFDDED